MSNILKILHQKHPPNFKFQTFPHNPFFQTQQTHAHLLKLGITHTESDLVLSYCQSKSFSDALQLFDETPHWDVVSTTTTIGHFAKHNRHHDVIRIFARMLELDIRPNEYTFGSVIHSSVSLEDVTLGKQFHGFVTKMGLNSNVFVGSSVVDMYTKLGNVEEGRKSFEDIEEPNVVSYTSLIHGYMKNDRFEDALKLFGKMPERNVVSWNALIGGCSQMGRTEEAINLFVKMNREGLDLRPSSSTFSCVFSAAGNIAALGLGKSLHASAVKNLGKFDVFVGNSLISFYAKCGNMQDSLLVFQRLEEKNVVSCNAVINGFAHNGRGTEALEFYWKMLVSGIRPNGVTLLCLLSACSHAGLVDEGYSSFNQMRRENPSILKAEHYSCVVDMLSRSGRFMEARALLSKLPFSPGIGFWKALLGGCLIHSNAKLAELATEKIHALDPGDVSSYIMLSNSNSLTGKWQNVSLIRQEMREKGMKRIPGCSWIEIEAKIHVFVTGDKRHSEIDKICELLGSCYKHLIIKLSTRASFGSHP